MSIESPSDSARHLAALRNRVHGHNVTDACTGEATCWCIDCEAVRKGADIWETPAMEKAKALNVVLSAARIETGRHDEEGEDDRPRCELCEAVQLHEKNHSEPGE